MKDSPNIDARLRASLKEAIAADGWQGTDDELERHVDELVKEAKRRGKEL